MKITYLRGKIDKDERGRLLHRTAFCGVFFMETCVLCSSKAIINRQEGASRTIYNCPKCGMFVVSDLVEKEVKNKTDEIESYLIARKLAKKDSDTVLISFEKANLDKDYLQLTVDKIVDFFPKTFSEQMEMALRNIGYMSGFPGQEVKIYDIQTAPIFYVRGENQDALAYLMESMRQAGLVEIKYYGGSFFPFGVTVAPKGWERLESPEKDKGTRKNIFAHSSSGDNKLNSQFFYSAVERISKECGYNWVGSADLRADTNITFELVSGVKSSELVICDFTEQTGGGYYAAAMAHSLGKACILTCHESAKKKLQFDTNQYRVIFWDRQEMLYLELLSTIKAMF